MNSLINALRVVAYLLLLLIGFGIGIAVGMMGIFCLIQVGETTGSDSLLNLIFGVLLFMASLGIVFFVYVWGERLK